MGPGTWTGKLHQLVVTASQHQREGIGQESPKGGLTSVAVGSSTVNPEGIRMAMLGGVKVLLDGPYGKLSVPVDRYGSLVLVAGGIGITPELINAAQQTRAVVKAVEIDTL